MPVGYIPQPVPQVFSTVYRYINWLHAPPPANLQVLQILGKGQVDYIVATVVAAAGSDNTYYSFNCDGVNALRFQFSQLNNFGVINNTPGISLTAYAVNGFCCMIITKALHFDNEFTVVIVNGAAQQGDLWVHPDLV